MENDVFLQHFFLERTLSFHSLSKSDEILPLYHPFHSSTSLRREVKLFLSNCEMQDV